MFPFWELAIAPVLKACRARRVVEIGALRGENTVQLLDALGPDAELHVIDPVPDFDPVEHARQFGGNYHFHQALSVDVLPTLPAMDAALIDGDHNWYTVYNECRLLADVAREAGTALPVMILHDVLWPYGRRDLYYDPATVPEEHRQPYAQKGMRPERDDLVASGGLNPTMNNALVEGGPRNGVMTGLEDFIAEHPAPVRTVLLPIYYGLAIVVEETRLDAEPELRAVLDRLEGAEGRHELLLLAERTRLNAMLFQHRVHFQAEARFEAATRRYLEVLKGSLLNEHYLEHELRLAMLAKPSVPDPQILRDPVRLDQQTWRKLERERSGPAGPNGKTERSFVPYTAMGRHRLDYLERCLDTVRTQPMRGDLVDCGTGRGGGAMFLRGYLAGYELTEPRVWVIDPFRAAPEPDRAATLTDEGIATFQADLNLVRDGFHRFGLLDDRVGFVQGDLDVSLRDAPVGEIALLRIGHTVADSVATVLEALYPRLAVGGFVLVELGAAGASLAEVHAYRHDHGITGPLERVDGGLIAWRKAAGDSGRLAEAPTAPELANRVPLAPPAPPDVVDLSVVVVMYNMRREAERTLRSLSRAYQEGVDDVTYEVLVVENGSDDAEALGAAWVQSFGPEFRYIDMAAEAHPSPVAALNRGIAESRGQSLALMIDGAHVLTPGVLRHGLAGLATYAPALVCTQQWYVGPGQQGEAIENGYTEEYEDRLFSAIQWPTAGYRLFEIGHFIGDRDWLDGMWESNCIFVERAQLEQVGAFAETFSTPGGGYANLELYERLGAAPDVHLVAIIGEGSFHQTHGGTTTNQPDPEERREKVFGYGQQYAEARGRPHSGPAKPIYYVGAIDHPDARRTKARRMSARRFIEAAPVPSDGIPSAPLPVPDELTDGFVEAVWNNQPWRRTHWLGRPIKTAPADLLVYQQIITTERPDWIVETGCGDGARSLFLASICDLVGHGTVVAIGPDLEADRPEHPRLRYIEGRPHDPDVVDEVRALVPPLSAMVVLGSRAPRRETVLEFEAYAPLVAVGSYAVIADTVVGGHPVWPGFGPGPNQAVKNVLRRYGDFAQDTNIEVYSFSFNKGGYLRRVRSE